jgi:hypothetical protein
MSNTFWDIEQKFQMVNLDTIRLDEIIPGVLGIVPNLYKFTFITPFKSYSEWKVYEDDFALLVSQGIWTPLGCDIDSLVERDFPKDSTGCDHIWQPYYGLAERYEYCTKCDKKRDC